MIWTLSIVAYFLAAALIAVVGARARLAVLFAAVSPFVFQLVIAAREAAALDSTPRREAIEWIPSLGVTLGFQIDALTLILTTVVAGIGLLIVIYSWRYFTEPPRRARFLALLLVFTGGMAGIVASDELLGLFVFWEVTTVASYLLIGFDDERAEARDAALQAILVTTAGGLAMLAGFVLLFIAGGTTSITDLVSNPPEGTIVSVALVLGFLGAFTKSAQFPFSFWLPGAMAAPTPASAYLHSATMVKAGIVLLLLLAPGFSSTWLWAPVVTTVGLITMVIGAIEALRQHDLKLLLAYGTVSQLGFMTALIGVGLTGAALGVLVAHAMFKAALFLVVGIIDKRTGTRDLRHLSGLRAAAPGLAVVAALAALSMAGIPPLLGFVTKEAAYDLLILDGDWVVLTVAALASALTVTYSARFWLGAFGGRGSTSLRPLPSPAGLFLPPAVLAAGSVLLGLFPSRLGSAISEATGQTLKLVLWPGWKPALAVSLTVIATGIALFAALSMQKRVPLINGLALPSGSGVYRAGIRSLNRSARVVTGIMQNGSLPVYLAVILTTVLVVPAVVWAFGGDASPQLPVANDLPEAALVAIAIVAGIAAARAQRRLAAVLLLGVVGYAVSGIYVVFGAPDLALTQLLIETLTVALFAIVLVRLPRRFGAEPRSLSRRVRLAVAAFVGLFVAGAAVLMTSVQPDRSVADAYIDASVDEGGRNVVNIILTNFRALDTLGEITVLAAAALGIGALVGVRRRLESRERVESP